MARNEFIRRRDTFRRTRAKTIGMRIMSIAIASSLPMAGVSSVFAQEEALFVEEPGGESVSIDEDILMNDVLLEDTSDNETSYEYYDDFFTADEVMTGETPDQDVVTEEVYIESETDIAGTEEMPGGQYLDEIDIVNSEDFDIENDNDLSDGFLAEEVQSTGFSEDSQDIEIIENMEGSPDELEDMNSILPSESDVNEDTLELAEEYDVSDEETFAENSPVEEDLEELEQELESESKDDLTEDPVLVEEFVPEENTDAGDAVTILASDLNYTPILTAPLMEVGTEYTLTSQGDEYQYMRFIPEEDGTYMFTMMSDDGKSVSGLVHAKPWYYNILGSNLNGNAGQSVKIRVQLTANETYALAAKLTDGSTGPIRVSVQKTEAAAEAGTVETGYKAIYRNAGEAAILTVKASPEDAFTYQWYQGTHQIPDENKRIEGATGISYTVAADDPTNSFLCIATDSEGTRHSVVFHVNTENHFDAWIVQGEDIKVEAGESIELLVGITGDDLSRVTYQWYYNGNKIENETASTYGGTVQTGSYECIVQDGWGGSAYADIDVEVDNGLSVQWPDSPIIVNCGETVTLHVNAQCYHGQLHYKWNVGASNTVVGTSEFYEVSDVQSSEYYWVWVSDDYGNGRGKRFEVFAVGEQTYPSELSENVPVTAALTRTENYMTFRFIPTHKGPFAFSSKRQTVEETHAWLYDEDGNCLNEYEDEGDFRFEMKDGKSLLRGKVYYLLVNALNWEEGKNITITVEDICGHNWNSGTVTKASSCKENGIKTYTCTLCEKTKTEKLPKNADHSWGEGKVTKAASCKQKGEKTFTCKVCGKTKTETISQSTEHIWGEGRVTKAATCAQKGEKTYTCGICGQKKTDSIEKITTHKPDGGTITTNKKKGTSTKTIKCSVCGKILQTNTYSIKGSVKDKDTVAAAESAIKKAKGKKEITGSRFAILQARTGSIKKTSIQIKWNKVKGADGYLIYGGKANSAMKQLADVTNTKWVHKGLKKGTYYQYLVVAYQIKEGIEQTVTVSKRVQAATTGSNAGNPKSIKVNNTKINLKKGKTTKLTVSSKNTKKSVKKLRKISYESSNPKVVTVTAEGKLKGVGKGTCWIYVFAQNGLSRKVKVRVK